MVPGGLLLITDRGQARHPLPRIADAALASGWSGVLLREKDLDAAALLEQACPIAAACRRAGRPLLVSDRLDVALALEGAGAHVGRNGIPVRAARELLGAERLLGYSAHDVEGANAALADGADYVTLSPIFSSRSKPGYAPRGIEFLARALGSLPPSRVLALGGVETPERVLQVRRSGAAGAAVMGAMMRAEDPESTAGTLAEAWGPGERSRWRVLFLCTGNSCRSQMAEGWARALSGDVLEPHSAGVETHGLNQRAVRAMAEAGVDISDQRSKLVDELLQIPFDLVVTVCDRARESCPVFPRKVRSLHRNFDDPPHLARDAASEEEAMAHYRRVRDEIRAFVETLPELLAGGSPTRTAGAESHD